MKYDIISDSASLITGAYALVNIQEILSIVILVLSIINILFNMVMRIYHHFKDKKYDEISNDISTTIQELEKIKEEKKDE